VLLLSSSIPMTAWLLRVRRTQKIALSLVEVEAVRTTAALSIAPIFTDTRGRPITHAHKMCLVFCQAVMGIELMTKCV
jgi:hypothetical protein